MDERTEFLALSAPLSVDVRTELAEVWDIGEQEAALATLISALTEADAALSAGARGRIAVLAEAWGCWETLRGALAGCRADDAAPATIAMIEDTPEGLRIEAALGALFAAGRADPDSADGPGGVRGVANPWPGHSLVAWFSCRRCADVLVRVHKTEPWGPDLIAGAYVLLQLGDGSGEGGGAAGGGAGLEIRASYHTGSPALTALISTHHRSGGRPERR
ncbi:MAG TPA: hypothetical protein VH372_13635 [Actinospica sp.]|jgi:hypothetical protein|nr:hypothetical protein [Actinospica sp.]